jgi:lipoprotein-releasing system permease protein
VLAGSLLGGAGVAAGLGFGVAVSAVMTRWRLLRFPADLSRVYMVDHIPFVVLPVHLAAVAATATALVVLASAWPAWRASRLDPTRALRAG